MTALLRGVQARQIGRLASVGAVLVALVISGCGGAYWQWSKPGASQQQSRQDGFECKQISRQQYIVGTGGMLLGGSEPNFGVWKECLEARGYTVTEMSDSQSSSQGASQSVSEGNRCVASSATVGTRVKLPDGKIGRITALYGASPRCSDPATPIVADIEEVSDSPSSSQSVSQGSLCVASNATVGAWVKLPNKKVKKVTALHGASPRCSDPTTPILVDVEEVSD